MVDDKTLALLAGMLAIPVAHEILKREQSDKYRGEGLQELVDCYFMLRKALKKGFDEVREQATLREAQR